MLTSQPLFHYVKGKLWSRKKASSATPPPPPPPSFFPRTTPPLPKCKNPGHYTVHWKNNNKKTKQNKNKTKPKKQRVGISADDAANCHSNGYHGNWHNKHYYPIHGQAYEHLTKDCIKTTIIHCACLDSSFQYSETATSTYHSSVGKVRYINATPTHIYQLKQTKTNNNKNLIEVQ